MLTHGGDIVGFEAEYGCAPLDFSVNTNPFGLPAAVKLAAARALERAGEYPDPLCRELRQAIAAREGVAMEQILCGSGAADLIWRLAAALLPRRALVTAPTFSEYAAALRAHGCRVDSYILKEENGFAADGGLLEAVTPETDVAFLCNPNNPTGLLAEGALLLRFLERCRDCGCLLVVDECFLDFLPTCELITLKPYLAGYKNLLILRAFTKTYAMAGLRLGYCLCADGALLGRLRAYGQSWPVSAVAQAAGLAALRETTYLDTTRRYIEVEREWLARALRRQGFRVYPGEANYLLIYADVPELGKKLAAQGILIRDCRDTPGLRAGYYRIAVRKGADNDRLLSALATARGMQT